MNSKLILIIYLLIINIANAINLDNVYEEINCEAIRRSSQAFSRNNSWRRTSEAFPSCGSKGRGSSSIRYTVVRGHFRRTSNGGRVYVRSHRRRIR